MVTFNYKFDDLLNPTLQAIHYLGGSASVSEIEEEVAKILKLSDEEINDIHRRSITKLSYRLAWARNFLKRYGLLENSAFGVWALTPEGTKVKSVDKNEVKRKVRLLDQRKTRETGEEEVEESDEFSEFGWKEELLKIVQGMEHGKFENLCQRMLRELGFINVEVTGRPGDGGIDGKGVLKLGGVLSFHVVFQSKRYKDGRAIQPEMIRDFRGAMMGRADKGIFITTSSFTIGAKKEAQREGATPIDTMDGLQFAEKLKDLGLGVDVKKVDVVEIKKDWFSTL